MKACVVAASANVVVIVEPVHTPLPVWTRRRSVVVKREPPLDCVVAPEHSRARVDRKGECEVLFFGKQLRVGPDGLTRVGDG